MFSFQFPFFLGSILYPELDHSDPLSYVAMVLTYWRLVVFGYKRDTLPSARDRGVQRQLGHCPLTRQWIKFHVLIQDWPSDLFLTHHNSWKCCMSGLHGAVAAEPSFPVISPRHHIREWGIFHVIEVSCFIITLTFRSSLLDSWSRESVNTIKLWF